MALPARPNARVGLPSGPAAARSRSVGRPVTRDEPRSNSVGREYTRTRTESTPSRPPDQLRRQRSVSNSSSTSDSEKTRGRVPYKYTPPVPPLPSFVNKAVANPKEARIPAQQVDRKDSVSSTYSSSSSNLSRQDSGYSTPATSVDDVEEPEEDVKTKLAPGFGSSLWGRVAAAAGNLTISVSRAWEANISGNPGEVTPPGQESRITRALKAYHIAQARQPSDLPEWLFDEKERGVTARVQVKENNTSASVSRSPPTPEIPRIPQTTGRSAAGNRPTAKPTSVIDDYGPAAMSRATQRLREMREAKANPRVKFAETVHPRKAQAMEGTAQTQPREEPRPTPVMKPPAVETSQAPVMRKPLPTVNISGRRPTAQGLPSGVRPRRV